MIDPLSYRKFHFVGIGGIGMSGLAHFLLQRGCAVSGSDLKRTPLIDALQEEGATIFIGHDRKNVRDAEVLVYSSCIPEGNPERAEGVQRGCVVISRGELLSSFFKKKKIGIAIAGSHGKTTTSALGAWLLGEGKLDPTYFIGGISCNFKNNAHVGEGNYFITEADESDGSFLSLHPMYTLLMNIDEEHLDYYGTFEASLEAYTAFLNQTREEGKIFACSDCPTTSRVLRQITQRAIVTFGLSSSADFTAEKIFQDEKGLHFDCLHKGKAIGSFHLKLWGIHNVVNALGIIALGTELRMSPSFLQKTFQNFLGVGRRFEIQEFPGLTIVEDYAHHPTEIKTTLDALEAMGKNRRLIGVFQPHRYSRTKLLKKAFKNVFQKLDTLLLTEIYSAGETPIPGIKSEILLEEIEKNGKDQVISYTPKRELVAHLVEILRPRDILIVMGAGDINSIIEELIDQPSEKIPWIKAS